MSDEVTVSRKEFRLQERTFFGVKHYRIKDVSKGEYFTLPNDGSDWAKLWDEGKILPELTDWEPAQKPNSFK